MFICQQYHQKFFRRKKDLQKFWSEISFLMYCRCHLPLHQKEKLWESYPTGLIHEHDENSFHTTFSLLYFIRYNFYIALYNYWKCFTGYKKQTKRYNFVKRVLDVTNAAYIFLELHFTNWQSKSILEKIFLLLGLLLSHLCNHKYFIWNGSEIRKFFCLLMK